MSARLFRIVWWPWLREYRQLRIVKVVNWRTCYMEALGVPRQRVTCCFWIFG
jgi:hypothetical protein